MKLDRKPALSLQQLDDMHGSGLLPHLQQLQRCSPSATQMEPAAISIITGFLDFTLFHSAHICLLSPNSLIIGSSPPALLAYSPQKRLGVDGALKHEYLVSRALTTGKGSRSLGSSIKRKAVHISRN
jgi:hypothetical protein